MSKNTFIPVCEPLLAGNELFYVEEAVQTGWISSSGRYVSEFEQKFADYCGTRYGVAVNTGTAALHLACAAAGISPGDEVIIPTFTMIASAFAVCYCRATPVFVDCEPETWNIDASKIEEKITSRTKAIMPVHIYGHPCDMDPILSLAEKYNLLIIEDAAEAHGAEYKGQKCGKIGHMGCFSFFANKIVTTGEGGMVVTDDKQLYEQCCYLKNMAFPLDGPRDYSHKNIGFNYRMSNVIAGIGLAQVERIDFYTNQRRQNASRYHARLYEYPGLTLPVEKEWAHNVYWMYGIVIEDEFGLSRDAVMAALRKDGIDTRCFFSPMHLQPSLHNHGCEVGGSYPVSEDISRKGLYLPSGSGLKDGQIDFICDTLKSLRK